MEFDADGHEAPLWEWCAAHTDDITSVGMVLNKLMTAPLWEWCSDSQNLCGSKHLCGSGVLTARTYVEAVFNMG